MDLKHPERLISHPLDGTVLGVLVGTTRPLTGREVARLASDGTQQGVAKALSRLAVLGVVQAQQAGRSLLYSFNREHLAAPAIEKLVGLRSELIKRLREEVANWGVPPVHASMFGSAARGDGDVDSDIDLFLVRPKQIDLEDEHWRSQLEALSDRVMAWTGNQASLIEVGEQELAKLRRERRRVLKEIRSDAVDLAGKSARQLLGRGN